ncbi:deoxynucleoside 5'-monophosphate N-glycosidase [Methanosarcina barkeri str. Wiesmoor]|uniref:Putative 2'-deoxynucleoside 5'-phosphate N-hydrolase 1 n=2 Tax=Methanosarcina barkeri TaxID=2208 RepID=DNPH1_METBF|nr:nucleoside 2-deoxyribosyltransferase [Methanosarcina barkeri]Q46CC9.1 RecName: Full=Putative 2'-deoxynucleoside 5'-phosphate N-hydrolase 1 [Methanosarcina barkeri str. Fusaro]AKB52472.1 deoxynucleoside 5'-monophosphate N-glycosidase [Methanosarcina barkeri str. Wiesmoor]
MKRLEKMEVSEKRIKVSEKRSPKIFLSGSIRGGRQLLGTYRFMFDTLEEAGAEVLSWHVADPELEKTEMRMTEEEIYARDMGLLLKSDALIAEVTVPSTGVGYEICRALVQRIPVLCLYSPDASVSAMVLGNPDHLLDARAYPDKASLKKIITEFILAL